MGVSWSTIKGLLVSVTRVGPQQRCHKAVSQDKTSIVQGCQTDRFILKPSSLASVKVNYWKIAVSQGVKGPSSDIFAPYWARTALANAADPSCRARKINTLNDIRT